MKHFLIPQLSVTFLNPKILGFLFSKEKWPNLGSEMWKYLTPENLKEFIRQASKIVRKWNGHLETFSHPLVIENSSHAILLLNLIPVKVMLFFLPIQILLANAHILSLDYLWTEPFFGKIKEFVQNNPLFPSLPSLVYFAVMTMTLFFFFGLKGIIKLWAFPWLFRGRVSTKYKHYSEEIKV